MLHAAVQPTHALVPLVGLVVFLLVTMLSFGVRCLSIGMPRTVYIQKRNAPAFWKWCMEWWVWLWGPVERLCTRLRIRPSSITVASTAATAVAAVLLGVGHLSTGGWVYLFAASLDLVDGRVARAQGTSSSAGAFLDSTLDRVAELLVFGGLAVHFRSTAVLYFVLWAAGSSVVVSYARARGESLGARSEAQAGGMQRAERVVLTGVPLAFAPLLGVALGLGGGDRVVGGALALLAFLTTLTALRRTISIWRALRASTVQQGSLANVRWLDAARRREKLGR